MSTGFAAVESRRVEAIHRSGTGARRGGPLHDRRGTDWGSGTEQTVKAVAGLLKVGDGGLGAGAAKDVAAAELGLGQRVEQAGEVDVAFAEERFLTGLFAEAGGAVARVNECEGGGEALGHGAGVGAGHDERGRVERDANGGAREFAEKALEAVGAVGGGAKGEHAAARVRMFAEPAERLDGEGRGFAGFGVGGGAEGGGDDGNGKVGGEVENTAGAFDALFHRARVGEAEVGNVGGEGVKTQAEAVEVA